MFTGAILAWYPTEVSGLVSRYFQNNISSYTSPYSHVSLVVCLDGGFKPFQIVESTFESAYTGNLDIGKFLTENDDAFDTYVFDHPQVEKLHILENIYYVLANTTKSTTYSALYRALIGFNRNESQVCTSLVLDVLGIPLRGYATVAETIASVSYNYRTVNV